MVDKTMSTEEFMQDMFSGMFVFDGTDEIGESCLIVSTRPDWVIYPETGEKMYVLDMFVMDKEAVCPNPDCGEDARHGLVVLKNGMYIVCCPKCKMSMFMGRKSDDE